MPDDKIQVNVNVPGLPAHVKTDLAVLTEKAKQRISTPTTKEEQDRQELIALRRSVESQHVIIKALRHNTKVLESSVVAAELIGFKRALRQVYDIPLDTVTELLCKGWGEFEETMVKRFLRDREA